MPAWDIAMTHALGGHARTRASVDAVRRPDPTPEHPPHPLMGALRFERCSFGVRLTLRSKSRTKARDAASFGIQRLALLMSLLPMPLAAQF
jgi:hypothetical protein